MVIDIKMCRFDNVPWGFRLVGGSDFEFPLTVVKVSESSIAEEAGLRVGDIIVRVNDAATSPLSHEEVNQIIRHCGNVFYLGVYREETDETQENQQFPVANLEIRRTPDSILEVESTTCKSPVSMTYSEEPNYLPDLPDRPCSVLSENAERKLVEEEIAAVLSGESEVLKEHNIMGIQPKPGVCMSSNVLRTLNEEATKTKTEEEKENRKWTTFLQKPNRPIPKSKAQIEAERRAANAYKVKIVKSIPKSPVPERVPVQAAIEQSKTTTTTEIEIEIEATTEPETKSIDKEVEAKVEEITERQNEAPTPTDSEVPSLEDLPNEKLQTIINKNNNNEDDEDETKIDLKTASPTKSLQSLQSVQSLEEKQQQLIEEGSKNDETKNSNTVETKSLQATTKTDEELALERQLADVQRQLVALSSLPSTIQSTLDAVTKQLAELLPAFKLQQTQAETRIQQELQHILEIDESNVQATKAEESKEEIIEPSIEEVEDRTQAQDQIEIQNNIDENFDVNSVDKCNEEVETLSASLNEESNDPYKAAQQSSARDEQNLKKEKKYDVIEELEEHLERKRNPKRSKRAFGPLTPSSERPLVLPGGRRWYRPKDAYNDEFIAEILSSQAELITGTTLGVNFMKYQKPERKIDLNRSEVYKVIHHLDRQPVRGIEVRPSMVAAEADIRRAVQS